MFCVLQYMYIQVFYSVFLWKSHVQLLSGDGELNVFSWSTQWFPRARLPEPGTGGGGGAGSPVRAGGDPASSGLPGQHLRFHHHPRLVLLLSADARHLPGLLLHPELWEFLWLPVTWAPGSPGSPSLPEDGRRWHGAHDRGDQDGQQRWWQFPRGVWRRAAAAATCSGQGGGFHYHKVIRVFYLPIMSYFAVMSYGNIGWDDWMLPPHRVKLSGRCDWSFLILRLTGVSLRRCWTPHQTQKLSVSCCCCCGVVFVSNIIFHKPSLLMWDFSGSEDLARNPSFFYESLKGGRLFFPYDVNAAQAKVISVLANSRSVKSKPCCTFGKCLRVPILTKYRVEKEKLFALPTVTNQVFGKNVCIHL